MRALARGDDIRRFMRALGDAADEDVAAYFTGGTTAVLRGWRAATVDIDVTFVPEPDALLRALPRLKHELRVNVELVSPADFVPVPAGWQDRSVFVGREGRITFYDYDPYAQALAKLERSHARDVEDVQSLIEHGLVEPERLRRYFAEIESQLYRFPAIDPRRFRERVIEMTTAP